MEVLERGKMKTKEHSKYQIVVKGHLHQVFSDRIGGMTITSEPQDDGSWTTSLTGDLFDQAELSGVLNTLYDLQLSIVSVQMVDKSAE